MHSYQFTTITPKFKDFGILFVKKWFESIQQRELKLTN